MFTADDIAAWEQSFTLAFEASEYEAWLATCERDFNARYGC